MLSSAGLPAGDGLWIGLALGGVLACKHALPHMLERGQGSIIFTSSTSSIAGEVAQFS